MQRLDIVWDQYKQDSLKADTREKQGKLKGIRRKVAASTKLPGNWQDFLKDNANKEGKKFLRRYRSFVSFGFPRLGEALIQVDSG